MTRYIWRGGHFVERVTGAPMVRGDEPISMPQIMLDIPDYVSPLGDGVISGRAARREHLKANNCREVDPSEHVPTYLNKDFARRMGREWDEDAAKARDKRREEMMDIRTQSPDREAARQLGRLRIRHG